MFTGIINHLGTVRELIATPGGTTLRLALPGDLARGCEIGDSIAVNGCCLTLAALPEPVLGEFNLSPQTLAHTAPLATGDTVHLEPALCLGDKVGGHFVTGHVDGCTHALDWQATGDNAIVTLALPPRLDPHLLAAQGSVTVAGVSLTVATAGHDSFSVQLVPHTLAVTQLNQTAALRTGVPANLEVDCLARYALRTSVAVLESREPSTSRRKD